MNSQPYIVGIAGGTGSGKTTIADVIVHHFNEKILSIPHDRYYRSQDELSMEERVKTNYDHPQALETDLLIQHIHELLNGNTVEMPDYDFAIHTRKKETTTVHPAPLILIEGILIYENEALRDLIDLKIFVDVPADIRIIRRIRRDVDERGRTVEMSMKQYFATIRPMHELFVEPSKHYSDILIPQGGHNQKGIQALIDTIENRLK